MQDFRDFRPNKFKLHQYNKPRWSVLTNATFAGNLHDYKYKRKSNEFIGAMDIKSSSKHGYFNFKSTFFLRFLQDVKLCDPALST